MDCDIVLLRTLSKQRNKLSNSHNDFISSPWLIACKYSGQKRTSQIVTTQLEEVLTTHTHINLYDHLRNFTKLELESRTKVELRYSWLGRLEDNN